MWVRICMVVALSIIPSIPAATLWARDIYVNNVMGDDRFDGGTAVASGDRIGPYRTLTRALAATRKGDRVIVANTVEPYRESITLQGARQSGYPEAPFELIGNGAVLEGSQPVPPDAWGYVDSNLFRFRPPKTAFQVLYMDGKPARRREIGTSDELAGLQPLEWCLYEQHVYFCVEPNRQPQSYAMTFTAMRVGITLYEVHHVIVKDLVIQGFQLDGVNAFDGVSETTLSALHCRGNGRSGISVGGASRVRLAACLVGDNGVAQVRTEGVSQTQLIGCDLLDSTAPRIVREGGRVDETR
ncbi:MAG: right-handed parallel beta-helix repeat-containing protein [Pirellulaceae bacterium]